MDALATSDSDLGDLAEVQAKQSHDVRIKTKFWEEATDFYEKSAEVRKKLAQPDDIHPHYFSAGKPAYAREQLERCRKNLARIQLLHTTGRQATQLGRPN